MTAVRVRKIRVNRCNTAQIFNPYGPEKMEFSVFPEEGKKYQGKRHNKQIQTCQYGVHLPKPSLDRIAECGVGQSHQQKDLRYNQRETQNGNQRGVLLGTGCDGGEETEYQAEAAPAKTDGCNKSPGKQYRIAQEYSEKQKTDQAHNDHQSDIVDQFCKNKIPGSGNAVVIDHSARTLLQKTFCNGVYTNEKLGHPE